jgi:AcrR family transcriptional regulator
MRMTAEERRESVLLAAVPEFARRGLAGTSTEAVARRAGVSQPYLFRLFPSKKELFLATLRRAFDAVEATFRDAAQARGDLSVGDAMGQAYRHLLVDRDLLLLQMQAYAASDDPDVRAATREAFGHLWTVVGELAGYSEQETRDFFAAGMLMNVAATLDLLEASGDPAAASWVTACLPDDLPAPA